MGDRTKAFTESELEAFGKKAWDKGHDFSVDRIKALEAEVARLTPNPADCHPSSWAAISTRCHVGVAVFNDPPLGLKGM